MIKKIVVYDIRTRDSKPNIPIYPKLYFNRCLFNKLANKNTFCVIGRPIYSEGDPLANITKIINSTN